MTRFSVVWICPECNTEQEELCADISSTDGIARIPWDFSACSGPGPCPECGCVYGTGDFDCFVFQSGNKGEEDSE